jgi:hypothetical protein
MLAIIAGFSTAARTVGVAVAASLLCHTIFNTNSGGIWRRVFQTLIVLPVSCWGLLAFMAYQYVEFGTAFAFAQTQSNWTAGSPTPIGAFTKYDMLAIGEPIWGAYLPDSPRHWQRLDSHANPLFSMFFWNPILFVSALVLVSIGAIYSYLTGPEVILGYGLLFIPYSTRAYEMSMASHGRFAAVVIPAYVVLGRLLRNQPPWAISALLGGCAMLLMAWTALFTSGYLFF